MEKMAAFDVSKRNQPLFCVVLQYMEMILDMLLFVKAVRTGDWNLHLLSLEKFTKYFFAHDHLNCARMIQLYLAEMNSLQISEPDIHREFLDGNWVVNKTPNVSFCGLGADHELEQINRAMKVSGGLVGITLNPSARTKFFLISPELSRLSQQAKQKAGIALHSQTRHHDISPAVQERQETNVQDLTATFRRFTNPFGDESNDLFNLVTKSVMPENVKEDLCRQKEIGSKLFETFVFERIQKGVTNLWSPMKKQKLATWKSTGKKIKVGVKDKVVELREDRTLFARLLVVCNSRSEINLKDAIGKHEFSVVPRSLFAADGSMLHCPMKSSLMGILEKMGAGQKENAARQDDIYLETNPTEDNSGEIKGEILTVQHKVAIIDAMAEVQSIEKQNNTKTCLQVADQFRNKIMQKYKEYDEIRLIFDRYDVHDTLKTATRIKRQGVNQRYFTISLIQQILPDCP